MSMIMSVLGVAFGAVMRFWYQIVENYGAAIILFTLTVKFVLLPLNVWLHKNSIKIIKLQASINQIKADYFGDAGTIADKQAELYKKENYNPLANLIPLTIQIVVLMGLVEVIYHPLTYILDLPEDLVALLVGKTVDLMQLNAESSSLQLSVVSAVKSLAWEAEFAAILPAGTGREVLMAIQSMDTTFLGFDVCWFPSQMKGILILAPIIAGFSSWLLCVFQNSQNVLQSEQGVINKYGTMALSVGLSLYLGWFVPLGVAMYWVFSNLFAIAQTMILNKVINPKKYVNYVELEESRKRLREIEALQPDKNSEQARANARREKEDYKRFFSIANKHVVFYSEKSGFYKYFKNTIEYLLSHSNLVIHYVTNDPEDQIFQLAKQNQRIHPYYIGLKKTITLMMKMDADMVIMTTPDLDNYYIKRSYVRKDVEYIYMPHGIGSTNMTTNRGAYDHFDTVLCVGQHQIDEIREMEKLYGTPKKNLVPCGFGMLDDLIEAYGKVDKNRNERPTVLIAPSWQEKNILDNCIDSMIKSLLKEDYRIVVRPHPEYIKRYGERVNRLVERWGDVAPEKLSIELDFSSNVTIFTADVVITDWSGIAFEFSLGTLKRTLFVDTPMKILNPDFDKYQTKPFELTIRNQIGVCMKPEEADHTGGIVREILSNQEEAKEELFEVRKKNVFHIGNSGEFSGRYLLERLMKNKRESAQQNG